MKKYIGKFFHRIIKDLKQKELLPLKFLFFMHSSTILVLYPYLTIHMRALGINVEETAIMSAVTPVVAILMPPVAGLIADKIGNFKVMLAAFSVIGGCSALLLLLVPTGRIVLTYPNTLVFGLDCGTNTSTLSLYQDYPCSTLSTKDNMNVDLQLQSCGISCYALLNPNYTKALMSTETYKIRIHNFENNSTVIYNLTQNDIFENDPISAIPDHRILRMNNNYTTSIRKLSRNNFYFPTTSNIFCDSNTNCIWDKEDIPTLKKSWTAKIRQQNIEQDDLEENRITFNVDYLNPNSNNLKCMELGETKRKYSAIIPLTFNDNPNIDLDIDSCSQKCLLTTSRKQVCSNFKNTIELDTVLTFWTYLSIRVFVGMISGTSFAMFEGAVIAILREHKADYGLQRIYATIGGMISSPISGFLIDYASRGKGYTDFRPIFFLYAALKIASGILMLFINLKFKKGARSVIAEVLSVLKKVELIALFISCVMLGCAWGVIESFLFWLLEDLGSSKSLMGLTVTMGGCVGIPLLVLSGPIIKQFGHANIIFVGFVFYAIRLLGYSLLFNPWYCLIYEAMESITFGLSFTAAVTYAAKLSTVTTDTSVQGLLGGLYYGVGKGVGSLIGGYLIKFVGIRRTFQYFAIVTIIIGFVYWAFYHFYMKKNPSQGTDITKKDKEKPQNETKDEIIDKSAELPVVFEDALCNPAFEVDESEYDKPKSDTNVVNRRV